MKIRRVSLIAAALMSAIILSACVPTEKSSRLSMHAPDFSGEQYDWLDEVQIYNDTIEAFDNMDPYVFIYGLDFIPDNAGHMMYVKMAVLDGTEEEDIEHFLSVLLCHMNDAAKNQISSIEFSSPESFGSLFDMFGLDVTAVIYDPDAATGSEPEEIYHKTFEKGETIPIDPDYEKYEEEWLRQYELNQRNVVYGTDGKIKSE